MTLRDCLTNDFRVAAPFEGTHAVKQSLLAGRAVVVMEDENFLGILTLPDLISRPHHLVIDALTPKPVVDVADAPLSVLMLMVKNHFDFLPVMYDGAFCGVVSRRQLVLTFLYDPPPAPAELAAEPVSLPKEELCFKNKFLTVIGHDIKNMFSQVLGSLELLDRKLENMDAGKVHAILKMARRSAEQVNTTFEGMLLWARLSTGQLPFCVQELLLNDHINKLVEQFQLAGNMKNVTIRNDLRAHLRVRADPHMLDCILLNLIYNAIKFSLPGGEVCLDASQTETHIRVVVADNGIGMNYQQIAHLFDQNRSTIGTANEIGAGIGLMICKDFVERHGGVIEVESEENRGTRVVVSLPKHPGQVAFSPEPTPNPV